MRTSQRLEKTNSFAQLLYATTKGAELPAEHKESGKLVMSFPFPFVKVFI
jgi:hypothetical protein